MPSTRRPSRATTSAHRQSQPGGAAQRAALRERKQAINTLAGAIDRAMAFGAYNAAADTRLMERIRSGLRWSADAGLAKDRPKLVAFSRAMDLNSAPARAVIGRLVDLVVGHEIAPRAAADSKAYDAIKLWNAGKDQMDARGIDSMGGLQRAAFRETLVAGDAGCALVGQVAQDAPAPQLQLIEPERIMDPLRGAGRAPPPGQPRVIDGVEINSAGRPVAYHVGEWDAFGGQVTTTTRIDASGFLMPAVRQRVGQTRGAPYLSSALLRLAMLEEYHTAVQTAASLHAMFAAVITTNAPAAMRSVLRSGSETKAGSGESEQTVVRDLMAAPTGSVLVMGPGEDMKAVQGSQPVANFDAYNQAVLRLCCAAAGLPVEVALLDVSRANFSVSRMAELMSQNTADVLRRGFLHAFVLPVWRFFVDWQISRGRLDAKLREKYLAVTWHAPPRKMIDPIVETETALMQINANLISKDDYIESQGGDPDAIRSDRQHEVQEEARLGITPGKEAAPDRQSPDRQSPEPGTTPDGNAGPDGANSDPGAQGDG